MRPTDATPRVMQPSTSPASFESALSLATRNVPTLTPAATVAMAIDSLRGHGHDCATHVVVLEGERFAGIIPLEMLLAARAEQPLAEVMDADPPRVAPGIDQERAAQQAVMHGEYALAVVDESGRFLGLVPPQKLLSVLLQEHEEDLMRLGGFTAEHRTARLSSEEPVWQRVRQRIPWLLIGIVGALLAAQIVSWFEGQLAAVVAIAFFIPGVVYLADAVGTQTETVVVRALSLGVPMSRMALREVLTGTVIGVLVALLSGAGIGLIWGDWTIALGVGIALFFACSIASAVALLLPAVLSRHGVDPAVGSGPLATVIQDLLSIVIYFVVMIAVLGERLQGG